MSGVVSGFFDAGVRGMQFPHLGQVGFDRPHVPLCYSSLRKKTSTKGCRALCRVVRMAPIGVGLPTWAWGTNQAGGFPV